MESNKFTLGQKVQTLDGREIEIIEVSDHDTIKGSDGAWRYNRPGGLGRCTGTPFDYSDCRNLVRVYNPGLMKVWEEGKEVQPDPNPVDAAYISSLVFHDVFLTKTSLPPEHLPIYHAVKAFRKSLQEVLQCPLYRGNNEMYKQQIRVALFARAKEFE